MPQSAAVLCQDKRSLQTLEAAFQPLSIQMISCQTSQEALESAVNGDSCALIVDFDLSGAEEVIRTAGLLPPAQRPALIAVASRAWPGTGQAFHSGASRILYKPIDPEVVKGALKTARKGTKANRRKSERLEVKTLVYLELENGTLAGISIDIGEHGLALQATEPVPISSNLAFRCLLPGTRVKLQGHADVIWASDQGRAGLFFSKLTPAARKHLKQWLNRRSSHRPAKSAVRHLLPPVDDHVSFAASEEQLSEEAR